MEIKIPSVDIIDKATSAYSEVKGFAIDKTGTYGADIIGIAEDCMDDYLNLPTLSSICDTLLSFLSTQSDGLQSAANGLFSGLDIFGIFNDMNGVDTGSLGDISSGLDKLLSKLSSPGLNVECLEPLESMYSGVLGQLGMARELSDQIGGAPSNMQNTLMNKLGELLGSGVQGLGDITNLLRNNIQMLTDLQKLLCGSTEQSMSNPDYYDAPVNQYKDYRYNQDDEYIV